MRLRLPARPTKLQRLQRRRYVLKGQIARARGLMDKVILDGEYPLASNERACVEKAVMYMTRALLFFDERSRELMNEARQEK